MRLKRYVLADESDDYILGIVSGAPFALGNGDSDVWNGMNLRDIFGRLIMEPAPKMETVHVFSDGHESSDCSIGSGYEGPAPEIVRAYKREAVDENGNTVFYKERLSHWACLCG